MADIPAILSAESLRHPQGPLRVRLETLLRQGISDSTFAVGEALPAERVIAECTGVSRVTVRRAIDTLVEEGLLCRRPGSGTFVAREQHRGKDMPAISASSKSVARHKPVTHYERLQAGLFAPSTEEIMVLGLSVSSSVSRLADLCFAGDEPVAIVRAAVPTSLLPDPRLFIGSVDDTLERLGSGPERALQKISACKVCEEDAALLRIPDDSLGLSIETVSYLSSGRPAAFTRSIFRGDAYDCFVELRFESALSADAHRKRENA